MGEKEIRVGRETQIFTTARGEEKESLVLKMEGNHSGYGRQLVGARIAWRIGCYACK
jgi:hypothetical protein